MVLASARAVFLIGAHHIAADGWSALPLAQDLTTAYEARRAGRVPQWEPLPVQYAVYYTLWQRELLGDTDTPGSLYRRQLDYWTTQLAGLPETVSPPADRPRPAAASYAGDPGAARTRPAAHRRRAQAGPGDRCHGVDGAQAALAALLTRLGAGTDVSIGSPIAGRTDSKRSTGWSASSSTRGCCARTPRATPPSPSSSAGSARAASPPTTTRTSPS